MHNVAQDLAASNKKHFLSNSFWVSGIQMQPS